MAGGVNPVPEGFHTVTPYLVIRDAAGAIEFYKEAFGAKEIFRWADPDGRVRHAEVVIPICFSGVLMVSVYSCGSTTTPR